MITFWPGRDQIYWAELMRLVLFAPHNGGRIERVNGGGDRSRTGVRKSRKWVHYERSFCFDLVEGSPRNRIPLNDLDYCLIPFRPISKKEPVG